MLLQANITRGTVSRVLPVRKVESQSGETFTFFEVDIEHKGGESRISVNEATHKMLKAGASVVVHTQELNGRVFYNVTPE